MEIESYGSVRASEICRTCLVEVDYTKIYYLDSAISTTDKTTIRHKLRDCIPELDLTVTPNAAICFDCLTSINTSHNFRKKCLQTEKSIKRFARRMGSIFVDLVQLVEQSKKSQQYLDVYPAGIKQEAGLAESHTYTRFFVKPEPVETPSYSSDDDDHSYQDSYGDEESFDPNVKIKQEPVEIESPKQPTVPVNKPTRTVVKNVVKSSPVFTPNNVCVKMRTSTPQPRVGTPPIRKMKLKTVSNSTVLSNAEKIQVDIKKKLLENGAISLKQIPKTKNTTLPNKPIVIKTIESKSESNSNNSDIKKIESHDKTTLNKEVEKVQTLANVLDKKTTSFIVQQTQTNSLACLKQATFAPLVSASKIDQSSNKLVVTHNMTGIPMKPDSPNVVYAILALVKPPSKELMMSKPETVSNVKIETQKLEKPSTPPVSTVESSALIKVKTEPKSDTPDPPVEVSKPLPPLVLAAPHLSVAPSLPSPVPLATALPPPPLVQITELSKPIKVEPKPVVVPESEPAVSEKVDTTPELGYNVNINDIPPLAPLSSDGSTHYDDVDITHLECTPNIEDYVNDEVDDDDSLHKCNDCEFECKGKAEFIVHLSTHLEEKFGEKSESESKKRDLYGRVKTLGGKLVYECEICNYRTALKRRYMFHTKLHQENKLLQCTQCNYLCATKSNLNTHMAVHTGHKPHKCTECGYSTVSKSALIVHTRIHTGDRPYSCGVCGYCTISKSALIVHNRIHTGSKPYRCPTCNYRTITKSSLTVHMRTHTGDKPFKCHLCDYSTRAKSALNVHVRIHEGYKPYQCTECEYRCSQRSGLNVHMRVHTGDKPFQCTECDYKCSNKSSLVVHNRTHTGETPYKCDECDYTTAWKSALNVHTRIHGDRKPFRCTECDYKCAQRSTLNVHMRIHTGDKPYQCSLCDYKCRYQGNLKMHMRVHTRETPFQCTLCEYSTTAKSALIVHHRVHTGEKPFHCTECAYRCSTKSSLKIHSRIHTGETPYECKRCLYKASSNSALKVHLRIHTGEKPFKCTYCSYRASNKGSIKVHLRVHTGETPYECSICDYKTTAKSALIVHMRIHTGDKPYKCEECSYRCNNKSSLKVHLKVHTGRTPYRCEICDYRCKKKFVLKRHLRVHRKEKEGAADDADDNDSGEASNPNLVTVKNEMDDSMEINEEMDEIYNEDEEEEETVEPSLASGYEGDLDMTELHPDLSVLAV